MSDGRTPGPLRILIVEDAMDQALLFRALLESAGYKVTTAQDGQHALEVWDSGDFDLVITDLNLPGMDGFDLARELKKPHRESPVIAVTGYTHQSYIESAYRSGVDALLHKPIDRDELLSRIAEMFPALHPKEHGPRPVLAIGARPGDVDFGVGGSLVRHREGGRDVVIYLLSQGPDGALGEAAARVAAEHLGIRVLFADGQSREKSTTERQLLLERVIRELDPEIAYIPSRGDDEADRREAHRLSWSALADVPQVFGYLTPSSTMDFRPTRFEIVGEQMTVKLGAMIAYRDLGHLELTGRFVQSAARWWGRYRDYAEVEPLEELKI